MNVAIIKSSISDTMYFRRLSFFERVINSRFRGKMIVNLALITDRFFLFPKHVGLFWNCFRFVDSLDLSHLISEDLGYDAKSRLLRSALNDWAYNDLLFNTGHLRSLTHIPSIFWFFFGVL